MMAQQRHRRLFSLLGYLGVFGLVLGGLTWVTLAALQVEANHRQVEQLARRGDEIRLALWRLDGRLAPALAREDSRPSTHYTPLYPAVTAFNPQGMTCAVGSVWLPSPLLSAQLPDWMRLHFQVDRENGWQSPQVLAPEDEQQLQRAPQEPLSNSTDERTRLLAALRREHPVERFFEQMQALGLHQDLPEAGLPLKVLLEQQPDSQSDGLQVTVPEFAIRKQLQEFGREETKQAYQNSMLNAPLPTQRTARPKALPAVRFVEVHFGSMQPVWLASAKDAPARLLFVRQVLAGSQTLIQGVLLDWEQIQVDLLASIRDLFPDGRLIPLVTDQAQVPEQTMTVLPVMLDPGPLPELPPSGWTPLRIGLATAWAAVLVALVAVAIGGWSLLSFSERRMTFVSAVTHELRTPLTTLRLYLDMLTSGMVRDEANRTEYLQTLHAESDRLHRLIGNVLDFARLEKQSPRLDPQPVRLVDLLNQIRQDWQDRCAACDKQLLLTHTLPTDFIWIIDTQLLTQILGNLIDNACKHTREAKDPRIHFRASAPEAHRLILEIADHGPGIPATDQHGVFRPFQRGQKTHASVGGVGLGLALARRWTRLLGGRLTIARRGNDSGACFRLEFVCRNSG